jgi:inorganic triphosphatase YgiF
MNSESTAERQDCSPAVETPPAAPALADLQLLLDLSPDMVLPFKQADLLTESAQRRPVTRKLRQVFWDTADFRLGRAGMAIAVQSAGQKRSQLLRNIKEPPVGGRILHQQDSPLSGETLDLTRLALLPGGDPAVAMRVTADMLVPVFALDLTRTIWQVTFGDSLLVVTLDLGTIESAAGSAEFRQIALAASSGPAQALYEFVQRLQRTVPAAFATHDPAQQGYRLVAGADWWPGNRNGTAQLLPSMSVREGILAIGRAATAALRANVQALETNLDPEKIHETRVAIRRLRSALSVFRAALPPFSRRALARDLGALASRLGHARELDVFLAETLAPLSQANGEESGLRSLRLTASVMRQNSADSARQAVTAPDFATLSCRLAAWFDAGIWPDQPSAEAALLLDQPFADYAGALLRKHHRNLLAAGHGLRDPQAAELHALRIQAKKLRYTAEFVRSLYPARPARRYIAALKAIQDILGTINDAFVAQTLLPQMIKGDPLGGARAGGLVAGWSAAEVAAARGRFAKIWKRFAETKRFWK